VTTGGQILPTWTPTRVVSGRETVVRTGLPRRIPFVPSDLIGRSTVAGVEFPTKGVVAALRAAVQPPPVLMFTTFDDDDVLWGALDAGAAGFILKDSSAEHLIAAARAVARGAAWLDPKVTPRVLQAFRTNVRPHLTQAARVAELTEHDVLRHMARGATNAEIAAALVVSEATIKTHVGAIFSKLGVRDRAAAIVFAYDHGIVDPHPGADRP
jgi:DNA-binding NarL/FixJ family response regulator